MVACRLTDKGGAFGAPVDENSPVPVGAVGWPHTPTNRCAKLENALKTLGGVAVHKRHTARLTGMADLATVLQGASLTHLTDLLASETLATLEQNLEAGRAPFLNHLKAIGLTALKDRRARAPHCD